jgi:hypothetical protein
VDGRNFHMLMEALGYDFDFSIWGEWPRWVKYTSYVRTPKGRSLAVSGPVPPKAAVAVSISVTWKDEESPAKVLVEVDGRQESVDRFLDRDQLEWLKADFEVTRFVSPKPARYEDINGHPL